MVQDFAEEYRVLLQVLFLLFELLLMLVELLVILLQPLILLLQLQLLFLKLLVHLGKLVILLGDSFFQHLHLLLLCFQSPLLCSDQLALTFTGPRQLLEPFCHSPLRSMLVLLQ